LFSRLRRFQASQPVKISLAECVPDLMLLC
jgi:hypothetical protein